MKFRVLIEGPVPPERVPPGVTLPPDAKEVSEYFIEAADQEAVIAMFEESQRAGLAHLKGRRIKSIEPVHNGKHHA